MNQQNRWENPKIKELFERAQKELDVNIEKLISEFDVENGRPLELVAAINQAWNEAHQIESALDLADITFKRAKYEQERARLLTTMYP